MRREGGGWCARARGRLGPQKRYQLVVHGLLSWPLVDEGIGHCFQYEGLVVYYL